MANGFLNGLVSYYSCEENTTNSTVADDHGSHDGTMVNDENNYTSEQSAAGQINNAFDLDGSNDYVDVAHTTDHNITGDLTVSAWVFHDTSVGADIVVTKGGGFGLRNYPFSMRITGGDNVAFDSEDASSIDTLITTTNPVGLGSWCHIVITRTSGNKEIWVDGSSIVGPTAEGITATTNTRALQIGRDLESGGADYFDGKIDEVGIWNRALSDADIAALYNSGSGVAYSSFDDGGTNMQINIGDAWKAVPSMKINVGDVWKDVAGAQMNVGDAWKTIF